MTSRELPRFVISKIDEPDSPPSANGSDSPRSPDGRSTAVAAQTPPTGAATPPAGATTVDVGSCAATENEQLMASGAGGKHMALYEDDIEQRPFVSRIINKLANYDGGVVPNVEQEQVDEVDTTEDGSKKKKKKKKAQTKKLGTVLGVFFPCVQNIFGVLLFIRLVWIVGTAGALQAFILASMCCACTMTTSISMSAIATNGVVAGGGSYFMISRALGPEFGGAVGLLFYLGTTVASSMYIVGAVEIFMQYMAPAVLVLFKPLNVPENAYNCYRVYGTILLLIMFICVFIGVKFVSKFSPVALFCVIFSIVCVYIGIFVSNPSRGPQLCFLGDRLVAQDKIWNETKEGVECHTRPDGPLYQLYCQNVTEEDRESGNLDPDCKYFLTHNTTKKPGIPGLNFELFKKNMGSSFTKIGNRIGSEEPGDRDKGDVVSDISASFVILIGIFFPSVTGIMAGSNRSGDLADAQKSIPVGTVAAVAATSTVYLSCLLLFAGCVEGQFMRDKFGESIGGALLVSHLAWPNPWVIVIGSFLSTCGAGLQSLVGAPRLLQAIAADGVIPFINPFAVTNDKGEPRRALYVTAIIAEAGVLLANVDLIAPIITMFFLMCYCFTNLACAVQTILKTPNWRPRFRFYHWILSLFGVLLCLVLMFMASWYFAIVALLIAAGIYKYIEYKGAEKEWGDGIRGLAMSAARYALLRLEEGPPHVKNWRPQLLVLVKVGDNLEPKYRKLFTFASQLKAGKGLTLVVAVLKGEHTERRGDAEVARQAISDMMKKERTKGFAEVIVARNVTDGLSYLIQGAGLGGLKHNTVLMGWPHNWREELDGYKRMADTLKIINERNLAVMIVKGIGQFPENGDRLGGTIDIWWIVHEGGLLMLIPFLLTQGKVWRKCKLRIFTVAQIEDNSIQMKKDLEKFLYQLRINAEVQVIEMPESDISAYTYERTLMMEQRNAMLAKMRLKKNSLTPQMIVDLAHIPHHGTTPTGCPPSYSHSLAISHDDVVNIPIDHPALPEPSTQHHHQTMGRFNVDTTTAAVPSEAPESAQADGGQAVEGPGVEGDEGLGHVNADASTIDDQDNAEASNPEDEAHWNVMKDGDEQAEGTKKDEELEELDVVHDLDHGKMRMTNKKFDARAPTLQVSADQGAGSQDKSKSISPPTLQVTTDPGTTLQDKPKSISPPTLLVTTDPGATLQDKSKSGAVDAQNVRRMTTAIRLNQVIKEHSMDAKLTIANLPAPPKDEHGEKNYMDFLEVLTEGLERVLLVRGGGREVVTIYS